MPPADRGLPLARGAPAAMLGRRRQRPISSRCAGVTFRAGAGGRGMPEHLFKNAVVDPEESVALWVADPKPRGQALCRKHCFVAHGTAQAEGGVREIRLIGEARSTLGNPVL